MFRPVCRGALLIVVVATSVQAKPTSQPAYLSFAADQTEYQIGDTAVLSWSSTNTRYCWASGDWRGFTRAEGVYRTPPLDGSKTYTLRCGSRRNRVEQTIQIAVSETADAPPEPSTPVPTLSLTAAETAIASGGSTVLSWAATDATDCTASDGWTGSRGTSGSETVGPLSADTRFSLDCNGPGGSSNAVVAIDVIANSPTLSLRAAETNIDSGTATTLTWAAVNATSCSASGEWSGSRSLSGTESISPAADATYALSCTGDGGTSTASINITVNAAAPTLSFSVDRSTVSSGGSARVNWMAADADSCTASGGWSGTRAANGTETVGPISAGTTYTLTCTGPGGSIVDMLRISVTSAVGISWVAPTENVDGTVLTDLAGYRIYYGTESRGYSDMVELMDPGATSHALNLSTGDYHVAMTAIDSDGNESAYSNEVLKSAP